MCSAGGRHRLASGGRARAAAIYPFQLCKAILRGFLNQMRSDGRLAEGLCGLQSREWEEVQSLNWGELLHDGSLRAHDRRAPATEEFQSMSADGRAEVRRQEVCAGDVESRRSSESFRDAIAGRSLDPTLVRGAMRKELRYFESKWVWHKRPRSEAYKFIGKPPISVNGREQGG